MTKPYEKLQQRLAVRIRDGALWRQALTHRSYAFEAGGIPTNERLEFLGDAVLGLIVTRRIYDDHPHDAEGRLAKLRAAAVNTQSLAGIARGVGVGDAVLLGRGEEQSGGRDKDSILADTLEALIGAVYLDAGLGVATDMVERLFTELLAELRSRNASLDYKTSLQELLAARTLGPPDYVITHSGPEHSKEFAAVVLVADEALGHGSGSSKKEAEQAAAEEAYRALTRSGPPEDDGAHGTEVESHGEISTRPRARPPDGHATRSSSGPRFMPPTGPAPHPTRPPGPE